ncbi:MAG: vitamin K epoxide reductase family protein [Planctomycetota bacterium]
MALAGLSLSSFLAYGFYRRDPLPGCGVEGCGSVLGGPWASVAHEHVSVAALGAAVWLAMNLGLWFKRGRWLAVTGALLALGAGAWFVFVQAVVLREWCVYCLVTHGLAALQVVLLVALRFRFTASQATTAVLGLVAIVAAQILFPVAEPESTAVLVITPEAAPAAATAEASGSDWGHGIDLSRFPRRGPADAQHTVVVFFDYTCGHCRTLHAHLEAALARFEGRLGVCAIPTPLNVSCNPAVPHTPAGHEDACGFMRVSLAVWRVDPSAHRAMEQHLFAGMDRGGLRVEDARAFAEGLVGRRELEVAMRDPELAALMREGGELSYRIGQRLRRPVGHMLPKLLVDPKTVLVGPSSRDQVLRSVQARLPSPTQERDR